MVLADPKLGKMVKDTESLIKKVFVKHWPIWAVVGVVAGGYYYTTQGSVDAGAIPATSPPSNPPVATQGDGYNIARMLGWR